MDGRHGPVRGPHGWRDPHAGALGNPGASERDRDRHGNGHRRARDGDSNGYEGGYAYRHADRRAATYVNGRRKATQHAAATSSDTTTPGGHHRGRVPVHSGAGRRLAAALGGPGRLYVASG
jgi:hypothetical protein